MREIPGDREAKSTWGVANSAASSFLLAAPPEKQRLLGEVCVCMREGDDSEQLPQGLTVFSLWLSGATAASTMVS